MSPSQLSYFDNHRRVERTRDTIEDECNRECKAAFNEFQDKVRQAMRSRDFAIERLEREP